MKTARIRWPALALLLLAAVPARVAQGIGERGGSVVDLAPFQLVRDRGARIELVPVRAGNALLVSTTLQLLAFAADTAELRWSAGPPEGWDALQPAAHSALFHGLDPQGLLVAPGAGERVALAALQIPWARRPDDNWNGIQLQVPLPERRLFAFELDSGCPLWNHAPPRGWDGTSGPFAQRMRVIGAPLVADGCVLVPCTYDESSIDYQVGCYELASGALLWNKFVKRGQIERNSFGWQGREFVAAPLLLDAQHGRVLVPTGFGVVVALELASGELVWRTEYEPIPLPKTRTYSMPRRKFTWLTPALLVVGDTLLVTSPDSAELLALDVADGHELWRRSASELSALDPVTATLTFDHLIGAQDGVLYLGGAKLSALEIVGGLRSPSSPVPLWTRPVEHPERCGRARLADDVLLLPGPGGTLLFERESGEPRGSFEHADALGLLPTAEALFVLLPHELRRIER